MPPEVMSEQSSTNNSYSDVLIDLKLKSN